MKLQLRYFFASVFVFVVFFSLPSSTLLLTSLFQSLTKTPLKLTSAAVLVISIFVFRHHIPILNFSLFSNPLMKNYSLLAGKRFNKNQSKEVKFALKNGGEVGGISNDGNTCFMNSVIQSLASSKHLVSFINGYLYENIEVEGPDGSQSLATSSTKSNLPFTTALKQLIDNVNGKYGTRSKEFSTKPLLNKMPNGPKQNFFTGYNQEDAQEFYQLVMSLLEKEYKKQKNPDVGTPDPEELKATQYIDSATVNDLIIGCDKLGTLGTVYVPAAQVDPNLVKAEHKMKPLQLITPVDGVSAERIGCLSCGEVGGIRYSVNSGISLNLPNKAASYYSEYDLEGLMNEWITPEIIEDVNCNRCGLEHTKSFLQEKILSSTNKLITEQFQSRLDEIEQELARPCVSDEAFEKLTIKQMTKKSKKSKQILLSRPPPLLSIHINRSVFDPRTYMIVKNSSKVSFSTQLDLTPFVAEPQDINMDARLPFRKQDKIDPEEEELSANITEKVDESVESMDTMEDIKDSRSSLEDNKDSNSTTSKNSSDYEVSSNPAKTASTVATPDFKAQEPSDPKLIYDLKAVISHYGTHNYGHYICYRKWRGTWWRISDESVYIVNETEVLNAQGTFMMFYEFHDGTKENLIPLYEEDFEEEPQGVQLNSDGDNDEDLYDSSSSDNEVSDKEELGNSEPDLNEFVMGEERAFHM